MMDVQLKQWTSGAAVSLFRLTVPKSTNVRLLCVWPNVGDRDAYIGARKWRVRCEHLGLQVDRQGKACPIAEGQTESLRRWPEIAYYKCLGRSERPDIEMQPAERLTHLVERRSSVP